MIDWMECWYNPKRRLSGLGMHILITFETLRTGTDQIIDPHQRCPAFGGSSYCDVIELKPWGTGGVRPAFLVALRS
jgi:hypothetical protein